MLKPATGTNKPPGRKQTGNVEMSMSNPVYLVNLEDAKLATSHYSSSPKYYTKIDAGIQLNNLTQEVNMPLLRLVHQLYSIIADAIEYDKEQNKLIDKNNLIKNQLQSGSNNDQAPAFPLTPMLVLKNSRSSFRGLFWTFRVYSERSRKTFSFKIQSTTTSADRII